jgi:transposase
MTVHPVSLATCFLNALGRCKSTIRADKGLPAPGLLAQVAVAKFSNHLPLYRLEDVFARGGVELSRSKLCR